MTTSVHLPHFYFYVNIQQSPFPNNNIVYRTTPSSTTMADIFAKTDVTEHAVMVPGFTAQLFVNEKGMTCHVIGPFDEFYCCYCFKNIKMSSASKHQAKGDPKCCPKMRDGSCAVAFEPLHAAGTVVYPAGARILTPEEKAENAAYVIAAKKFSRNFRNKRLVVQMISCVLNLHIEKLILTQCVL